MGQGKKYFSSNKNDMFLEFTKNDIELIELDFILKIEPCSSSF